MSRGRVILLAALICLGAIAGGTWFWFAGHDQVVARQLRLFGNVDIREVELSFDAQGRIEGVEVEEGDPVEKDRLLAVMDDERFRHELAGAQAREESQRQVVARLEAGTRPEEIRKARADVKGAEARLVEARRNRDRVAELVPTGAASQQDLDDATAAHESAEAELGMVRAALDLAEAGPRREDILSAKARLEQLSAETALAQWSLEQTRLVSPAHGVIRQRFLEPGDLAARDRPVFTLALTDPIWVRAYLAEPDLGKVRPGMSAWVTTDSFPDKRYEGWIGFISPTAEFTPKTIQTEELRTKLVYEVRVYVHNPQNELRLGMPATVTIPLQDTAQTTSKPAAGRPDPGGRPRSAPGGETARR